MYSQKDNFIFHSGGPNHLNAFVLHEFLKVWSSAYQTQPRKFKIHRSAHSLVFLGVSIYAPYRYMAVIDTAAVSLLMSKSVYVNSFLRAGSRSLAYVASILIG